MDNLGLDRTDTDRDRPIRDRVESNRYYWSSPVHLSSMDRTDWSVFVVFGLVSVRFGPSSFLSRSGPTPSPKLSVLHIGPNRTETEPMLSIPGLVCFFIPCDVHVSRDPY